MNRVALWLMTGVSAWLVARSLKAHRTPGAAPAFAPRAVGTQGVHRQGVDRKTAAEQKTARPDGARDRVRMADAPSEIPPVGWKDILIRTYNSINEDRVFALAAGVTYYILLALFPGIAALVSIYGLIADPGIIEDNLATLSIVVPGAAI